MVAVQLADIGRLSILYIRHNSHSNLLSQATGDEFLDKLLSTDSALDEGAVPDIKVMDSDDISMMSGEVNASTLLDFFNQLTSKSSSSLESLPIKEEPLSEEDLRALQKDRQKKDNHNLSKLLIKAIIVKAFFRTSSS